MKFVFVFQLDAYQKQFAGAMEAVEEIVNSKGSLIPPHSLTMAQRWAAEEEALGHMCTVVSGKPYTERKLDQFGNNILGYIFNELFQNVRYHPWLRCSDTN